MLTTAATPCLSNGSPWDSCLALIQQKVGPSSFETWFRTTELVVSEGGAACIQVPNQLFADFIEEHFGALVREVLRAHHIDTDTLTFVPVQKDWRIVEPLSATISESRERSVPKSTDRPGQFHSHYTFDSFVVGDSNRMAHAAAFAVAEAPGKTSFNPLVLYGGTGLGKTHLLQAVGAFAQEEETAEHVVYMASQEFVNQYIDFVVHKHDSSSFYRKFNDVDMLLIDDIHFFSGKPANQKEFFRIFSRLLRENKQIVLTSDRPPDMIPDMMEHIISRFMGGLMADIQPPNLETRVAILKKKAETDGYSLPNEVVGFVASNITSNVRELEGILIKLIAHSTFTGRDISLDIARTICGDLASAGTAVWTTVPSIVQAVAEAFGTTPNQLTAHTRRRDVALPRAVAMYLCRRLTRQSLHTIGAQFGGRDYSTVIHSCRRAEAEMSRDETLRVRVMRLESSISPPTAA